MRRFAGLFVELFGEELTADLGDLDSFAQIRKAMELAREHPIIQVPQNFVLLGRVFATLGGMLLRYKPNLNLSQLVLPYLARALAERPSD